jgi:rhamnulokinase
MTPRVFAAVDLGASSGRVIAGVVDQGTTTVHTVHRFPNLAAVRDGHLRWGFTALFEEVVAGLRQLAICYPEVASIGIDTWGVDYGLLDDDGRLLAEPISYRDPRTGPAMTQLHEEVGGPEALYAVNGLQPAPISTIYQLRAEQSSTLYAAAKHAVLLPDLLVYWLTGELGCELTNASTTGLLDPRTRRWSPAATAAIGLPDDFLLPLRRPGEVVGPLRPEIARSTGLSSRTVVTAVGSHDTASAVVGLPSTASGFGFVSCGTWSLAGLEVDGPVVTGEALQAGMSNECGVDDHILFVRNLNGLWLLQESQRAWAAAGTPYALESLLGQAHARPAGGPVINVDSAELLAPGDMPARIEAAVVAAGYPPLESPAAVARCILDSLAVAYVRSLHRAASLAGSHLDGIHLVGGGSRNALLCQRTADLAGVPVTAGPIEATALGNILVQARAHGATDGTLDEIRARSAPVPRFLPERERSNQSRARAW